MQETLAPAPPAEAEGSPNGTAAPKFEPSKHLTNLNPSGAERLYMEVKWRLVWLRAEHPTATVETAIHSISEQSAVVTARITLPSGAVATGIGTADKAASSKFSGRIVEKAETAALGRACAALGYGTQFSGGEYEDAAHPADSPATSARPRPRAATAPAPAPAARSSGPATRSAPAEPTERDIDERTKIADGQIRAIRAAIKELFGADEQASYEWMKEAQPRACEASPTTIHLGELTMAEASVIIKAQNAERARRKGAG